MKLDMKTVAILCDMPDDRLFFTLRMMLASKGIELPDRMRGKLDLSAARTVLRSVTESDIERVNELGELYHSMKRRGAFR